MGRLAGLRLLVAFALRVCDDGPGPANHQRLGTREEEALGQCACVQLSEAPVSSGGDLL